MHVTASAFEQAWPGLPKDFSVEGPSQRLRVRVRYYGQGASADEKMCPQAPNCHRYLFFG